MPDSRDADMDWSAILSRIEAGERHREIAEELGLSIPQFRYRLYKLRNQVKDSCGPSESFSSPLPSPPISRHYKKADPQYPLNQQNRQSDLLVIPEILKNSLFDESWHRQWKAPRLEVCVRNSTSLFAYWEVASWQKTLVSRHFQSEWRNLPFFLALYDVTDVIFDGYNAVSTRRIPVGSDSESWYIHQAQPGRNYVVGFGTATLENAFFTILQSRVVRTPSSYGCTSSHPTVNFLRPHLFADDNYKSEQRPESPLVEDFFTDEDPQYRAQMDVYRERQNGFSLAGKGGQA